MEPTGTTRPRAARYAIARQGSDEVFEFVSPASGSPNPDVVDGPKWNEPHVLTGGVVDQVLTRDPAFDPPAGDGWKWAYPKLRETGGPTTLTPGAIPDGAYLKREGSAIVGVSDPVRVLDRKTTTIDVVNTTVMTDLYRFTLPGGTLGVDRAVRLTLLGDYLNNSATSALLFLRFSYGGTIVIANVVGAAVSSHPDRRAWQLLLELHAKGATGSQAGSARWEMTASGRIDASDLITTVYRYLAVNPSVSENSALARDLSMEAKHNMADPNVSLRMFSARLELL